MSVDISVVIPLLNEEESLRELHDWIVRVMREHGYRYEIIFVDDGSTDGSWRVIEELAAHDIHVKGIKFLRNYGKSPALNEGFKRASGQVIITMDADLQDSPDEIPGLRHMIMEEGYDLVSGWKKKRHDPITKTVPTKLFNWATRRMSGIKLHDFNCGLKAYRLKVVKSIEVYGEMHRYVPVLAKNAGFRNIGEKAVSHQARKYGYTKFGLDRFINGFLDLMTLYFIGKFGKRPMHFFGTFGVLMFVIGFGLSAYLGIQKLYFLSAGLPARLVTENPWFFIALTTMILGTLLFMTGFLAEMIARTQREGQYNIERLQGF